MNIKCITSILNSINDRTELMCDGYTPIRVINSKSLELDDLYTDDDFNASLNYCINENLIELSENNKDKNSYYILHVTEKGEKFLEQNS